MRRAADRHAELQNTLHKLPGDSRVINVKSGRDRDGGSDNKLIYIRWPQEAVFIRLCGPLD